MAHWNTIFVDVPLEVLNPVKTVNDLLRPEHQASGAARRRGAEDHPRLHTRATS